MMSSNRAVIAYLGLGSNLENPLEQLRKARQAVAALDDVDELLCSGVFRSLPMGPSDQPDYLNAVMSIKTIVPPQKLLDLLQAIEIQQGRVKLERWGARTIDVDILLYGDLQIDSEQLTIPHPGMAERAFVLYPLRELVDDHFMIPGKGLLCDLIKHCSQSGLQKIQTCL